MTLLPLPDARSERPLRTGPLVARTVAVPLPVAADLISVIPDLAAEDVFSWVRRGEGFVGWGRVAEVPTDGPDRFARAEAWWQDLVSTAEVYDEVGLAGTGPVALGSFAYSAASATGASLTVPQVVVGRRGEQAWVTTMGFGAAPELPDLTDLTDLAAGPARQPSAIRFADGARSSLDWAAVVRAAVERITEGELDKVVLARDLEVDADDPIDVRWLLARLAERYDTTWVFSVDGLVGATPELLVRLDKGLVHSRVLAGTIRRTGDDEHDLALAASLARSSKDLEEHEYAVRSVADALRPHCYSMNVPESPFVLHLTNVMHLATDVAGVLGDRTTSLTLAASLHPSAAVCGTPTSLADAVIAEIEGMDRGRYAGPVGWMDATGDGEWGIALRCGALDPADPSRMRLFAGCGIVAGSDPDAEVAESDAKFVPMRDALTSDPLA
ncbi:MAG TPA: isochorismate synthase [Intrasporangiaceae bacterium]|nr:isochorismate synthase [Intrasporangiaceae bacterium]